MSTYACVFINAGKVGTRGNPLVGLGAVTAECIHAKFQTNCIANTHASVTASKSQEKILGSMHCMARSMHVSRM